MRYNELKIEVGKTILEQVETLLIEHGYTSMMIDDPADAQDILDHPDIYRYDYISDEIGSDMNRRPVITLYFEDNEDGLLAMKQARELLTSAAGLPDTAISEACSGDDSEWLYKWQEYFKPTRVGSRIVVRPSWEDFEADDKDLVIEMDPGMAFGSGLHETTSMCIKALEQVLSKADALSRADALRILDVGTGTGILAIAGVLLGAGEALGIDIDPDAVRVAGENIARNGLTGQIRVQYGDLTDGVDYHADIVAANLMADLVIRLSPAAARHLSEGGIYITSGILDIKEEVVSAAIREAGFAIEEILHDGEWCAVIAVKRPAM